MEFAAGWRGTPRIVAIAGAHGDVCGFGDGGAPRNGQQSRFHRLWLRAYCDRNGRWYVNREGNADVVNSGRTSSKRDGCIRVVAEREERMIGEVKLKCGSYLAEVVFAGGGTAAGFSAREGRKEKAGEDRDDGDHDEEFNECDAREWMRRLIDETGYQEKRWVEVETAGRGE